MSMAAANSRSLRNGLRWISVICTIRNPSRSLGRLRDGDRHFGNPEMVAAHNPELPCPPAAQCRGRRPRPARSFRRAGSNCGARRQTRSASDNPINQMVSTSEAHSSQVHHWSGKVPQDALEFQQVSSHQQGRGSGRAQPDQTAPAGRIQQPADNRKLKSEAEKKQAQARKEVHAQNHWYHSNGLLRFAARMLHWCCNSLREIPGRLMVGQRPLEP